MENKFGLTVLAISIALVMLLSCITPCIAVDDATDSNPVEETQFYNDTIHVLPLHQFDYEILRGGFDQIRPLNLHHADNVSLSSNTYYVNPGESIQDAVDTASDGDTIIVRSGVYTENVDVSKWLTIKSESGAETTIVQAAKDSDHVFEVTTDYVIISGFTIKGANRRFNPAAGIYLYDVYYCNISNNKISNNTHGICLDHSNNNKLINNNCSNNGDDGIDLWFSSNNNLLKNNNCSNNWCGIRLWDSSNNQLISNNCSLNNRQGIRLAHSSNNNTLKNNNCSNNGYGIDLYYSSNNNVLKSNSCLNNGYYGIFLRSSSNNNTLKRNNCSNNRYYGIHPYSSSNNNRVYFNNFINNGNNACSSANKWNSTSKITYTYNGSTYTNYLGNYWDDYTGNDTNNDGIGDTPYSNDNYPLINPLENYISVENQPPIALFTYTPEKTLINQTITFNASYSYDPDGNITNYEWEFGDGSNATGITATYSYSVIGIYEVALIVTDDKKATDITTKEITVSPSENAIFDTGLGNYPSIFGKHEGIIKLNKDMEIEKLFTYPCLGTGGHSEYVAFFYLNGTEIGNASWKGYQGDWHNITFDNPIELKGGEEYKYLLKTGSYPQIIHEQELIKGNGKITCLQFVDANGRASDNWIPAIKLIGKEILPDTFPPSSIMNLDEIKVGMHYILWNWTNPKDPDFAKVMVYLDDKFKMNLTKPINQYNATNLTSDTEYKIGIKTVDENENINENIVEDFAKTSKWPENMSWEEMNFDERYNLTMDFLMEDSTYINHCLYYATELYENAISAKELYELPCDIPMNFVMIPGHMFNAVLLGNNKSNIENWGWINRRDSIAIFERNATIPFEDNTTDYIWGNGTWIIPDQIYRFEDYEVGFNIHYLPNQKPNITVIPTYPFSYQNIMPGLRPGG